MKYITMEIERSGDMNFVTQNTNMLHSIVIDLIRENQMTAHAERILETFRSIVKNTNTNILTPKNIKEYNKFVMIEMKKRMNELQKTGPTGPTGPYLANDIRDKRIQSIDDAFQKRQSEFNNGMTVKTPEPIDFTDNNKVNGSIDDLLNKTLQQREYVHEPVSQPMVSQEDIISGCFVPSMYTVEYENEQTKITLKQSPWQKLLYASRNEPIVLERIAFQKETNDTMIMISSEIYNHGIFLKQEHSSVSLFDGYFVMEKKRAPTLTLDTVIPKNTLPILIFSRFSSSHSK